MAPFAVNILRERHPAVWGSFSGRIACGTGWFALLDYFGHCLAGMPAVEGEPQRILQVKEKFGELRIYLSRLSPAHVQLVSLSTHMSRHVCELCGEPGECRVGLDAATSTRCDEHVDYPASVDDFVPSAVAALVRGETAPLAYLARAHVTRPPRARLSAIRMPFLAEEATRNRDRFMSELSFLVETGALSDQLLALLCIATAALEFSNESEKLYEQLRMRSRALAATESVQKTLEAILKSWARWDWWR